MSGLYGWAATQPVMLAPTMPQDARATNRCLNAVDLYREVGLKEGWAFIVSLRKRVLSRRGEIVARRRAITQ